MFQLRHPVPKRNCDATVYVVLIWVFNTVLVTLCWCIVYDVRFLQCASSAETRKSLHWIPGWWDVTSRSRYWPRLETSSQWANRTDQEEWHHHTVSIINIMFGLSQIVQNGFLYTHDTWLYHMTVSHDCITSLQISEEFDPTLIRLQVRTNPKPTSLTYDYQYRNNDRIMYTHGINVSRLWRHRSWIRRHIVSLLGRLSRTRRSVAWRRRMWNTKTVTMTTSTGRWLRTR